MSVPRRLPAALAGVFVLAAAAPAQPQSIKPALPPSTIAFFTFPDLDKSLQELMDMPLLRMWRQGEVQGFLAPALAVAKARWNEQLEEAKAAHAEGALPFSPDDLLALRLRSATAALTSFAIAAQKDGGMNPSPVPEVGLLLHLDFGASATQWKKVIEFGLGQLEERAGDMVTRSETKVGERTVTSWTTPEVPMGLHLAWVGNGIVVGSLARDVTAAVQVEAAKDGLISSPAYQAVAANLDLADDEFELFVSVQNVYRTALDVLAFAREHEPAFPPELDPVKLDQALQAFGLGSIKAFGLSSSYTAGKSVTRSYTYSPAPERKGIIAGGQHKLDLALLEHVPQKATSCSAGTFDLAAIWDAAVTAMRAYDADLAEGALAQLSGIEQKIGFTIREDLLGAFGNQYVKWAMPMQGIPGMTGGPLFNDVFLVSIRDQDRLLKSLRALTKMSDGMVELGDNTRNELTTYYLTINAPSPAGLPFNVFEMITPVFAFEAGHMVLGFSKSDVRRTIDRMRKPEGGQSIRANPEFAKALEGIDTARLTSLSFSDLRPSFDSLYQAIYGFGVMLPEEAPVDLEKLPDEGRFLSQHLFPSVSFTQTDGNGFATQSVGPFGPELVAIVLMASAAVGFGMSMSMR